MNANKKEDALNESKENDLETNVRITQRVQQYYQGKRKMKRQRNMERRTKKEDNANSKDNSETDIVNNSSNKTDEKCSTEPAAKVRKQPFVPVPCLPIPSTLKKSFKIPRKVPQGNINAECSSVRKTSTDSKRKAPKSPSHSSPSKRPTKQTQQASPSKSPRHNKFATHRPKLENDYYVNNWLMTLSEPPRIPRVEPPRVPQVGPPRVPQVESPRVRQVESPRVRQVESPRVRQVESPRVRQVESPRVRQVESPRVRQVESPRVRQVESPRVRQFESPRVRQVESPRVHQVEPPAIVEANNGKNDEETPMIIDDEEILVAEKKDIQHMVAAGNDLVDPVTTGQSNSKSTPRTVSTVHVVVDTNILTHDLMIVDDLRKMWNGENGSGTVIIVIPWTVLQEVDRLKDDKGDKNPDVKTKARNAVRYLNELLASNDPQIKGQTAAEAKVESDLDISCPDDTLLECCLQCKAKGAEETILLTNDRNLRNKAMVNKIRVHSKETIMKDLDAICPMSSEARKLMEITWEGTHETGHLLSDDILKELKHELQAILETIVRTEMHIAYGKAEWLNIVIIQPPWRLLDVLKCLQKHWIAVFGLVVDRKAQEHLTTMCDKFKLVQGSFKKEDLKALLVASLQFLRFFDSRPTYRDRIKLSTCKIRGLLDKLKDDIVTSHQGKSLTESPKCVPRVSATDIVSCSTPGQSQVGLSPLKLSRVSHMPVESQAESEVQNSTPVLKLFDKIWSYIHRTCGMIYDSFNLTNPILYVRPARIPSRSDSMYFFPKLFPQLMNLKDLTEGVLFLTPHTQSHNEACNKLYFLLTNFFSHLDMASEDNGDEEEGVSPETIFNFSQNPETRDVLKRGLNQLEEMTLLMYQCALNVMELMCMRSVELPQFRSTNS